MIEKTYIKLTWFRCC